MPPIVNLSNHPSADWSPRQREMALTWGQPIVDVPFPRVPSALRVEGLSGLVEDTLVGLPAGARVAVVAGEHTLTVALVRALQASGVRCVAAASERLGESGPNGKKHVEFRFEQFREYPGNPQAAEAAQVDILGVGAEPRAAGPIEAAAPGSPPPLVQMTPPAATPGAVPGARPTPPTSAGSIPSPQAPAAAPAEPQGRPPNRHERLVAISQKSWYGSPSEITAAIDDFLAEYPGENEVAQAKAREGRAIRQAVDELEAILVRHGPDAPESQRRADEVARQFPWIRGSIHKKFERAYMQRERAMHRKLTRAAGGPLTSVRAGGEHRVHALSTAQGWSLWIDETGDRFDGLGSLPGRVVGILVPEGVSLPSLAENFHASACTDAQVDAAVQTVLDAPVGVFGVSVDGLGPAPGERWSDAVLELVAWVARLLPMPPEGTVRLVVRVEQRGDYAAGERWRLGVRDVLRRLSAHAPARAARLELSIQTVKKDGRTPLGQVDAVAFTWGSPSAPSRARFTASGLADTCCIDVSPELLRVAWGAWDGARPPDGATWRALVAAAGENDEGTLLGRLLEHLVAKARGEPALWGQWAEAVAAHLDSKAVNLQALGHEVSWLDAAAPEGTAVPPRLRLMWRAAQLAEANHRGGLDEAGRSAELEVLSTQLFEEDPRLVCLADLNRAVLATNRLDFTAARAALQRWRGAPVALPGLQLWGRLRSSEGQHHGFEGNLGAARECFEEALRAFSRLSDPAVGRLEALQTGAYLAIVSMDDPDVPDETARVPLEAVIGPLDLAIQRICPSVAAADKYAHHLLMRWLVVRGSPTETNAWLATRPHWKLGEGHPWPLVGFYRAALLHRLHGGAERVAVQRLAADAVRVAEAPGQGWAVRFIGATLGVAATAWGCPWPRAQERLAALREAMPLGDAHSLARFLVEPADPLVLLTTVLPFNFR